jgi:hypothetical protein
MAHVHLLPARLASNSGCAYAHAPCEQMRVQQSGTRQRLLLLLQDAHVTLEEDNTRACMSSKRTHRGAAPSGCCLGHESGWWGRCCPLAELLLG